jgi:hypothetical protein
MGNHPEIHLLNVFVDQFLIGILSCSDIFLIHSKCPSTFVDDDVFLDSSKIRNTSVKLILSSLTTLDINILAEAVPM